MLTIFVLDDTCVWVDFNDRIWSCRDGCQFMLLILLWVKVFLPNEDVGSWLDIGHGYAYLLVKVAFVAQLSFSHFGSRSANKFA